MYKHYNHSVGHNYKHVQITTKYRYEMMRTTTIKTFYRVSIEEACQRHKIEILNVQSVHVHMIVDCPRTMCDAKLIQIIKGLSSYLLFRICPNLRKRYLKGHFCCAVGVDFEQVMNYVEKQELRHTTQ